MSEFLRAKRTIYHSSAKYVFILFFGFLLTIGILWLGRSYKRYLSVQQMNDYRENPHYHRRMDLFSVMPVVSNSIVMLGDSLTEMCDWGELLNYPDVINRGISGDGTEGVLARVSSVVVVGPNACFVMMGINDLQRGLDVEQVLTRYWMSIAQLTNGSVRVVVQSCLPVAVNRRNYQYINEEVRRLNSRLKSGCDARGIEFIDMYDSFADTDGNMRRDLTLDGVHLKGRGYSIWSQRIKESAAFQAMQNNADQ